MPTAQNLVATRLLRSTVLNDSFSKYSRLDVKRSFFMISKAKMMKLLCSRLFHRFSFDERKVYMEIKKINFRLARSAFDIVRNIINQNFPTSDVIIRTRTYCKSYILLLIWQPGKKLCTADKDNKNWRNSHHIDHKYLFTRSNQRHFRHSIVNYNDVTR